MGHTGSSIGFTQTWGILLVGQAVNMGVPARAGDVARIYLISEAGRLPMAGAFTTLMVEKFFDLTTLLLILVPISTLIDLPPAIDDARRGFVVVAVVLPLVVMILAWRGETLIRLLERRGHGASSGWVQRLASRGDAVLQSPGRCPPLAIPRAVTGRIPRHVVEPGRSELRGVAVVGRNGAVVRRPRRAGHPAVGHGDPV